MRISIVKGDPGYDPTHTRRVRSVTVDGTPYAAVTADDQEGFADVLCTENGRVQMDPFSGQPLTKRLLGRVVIELMPRGERDWDQGRRGEAKVRVGREPGTGDILVQVYSAVRPGAIKQGRMHRAQLPSGDAAVCQKVGVTAGALAEMLCDQFRDTIDPDQVAREALTQASLMLRDERTAVDVYGPAG